MPARTDVAIIGAGHNGLVAANYLARAGLSVAVFEARPVVGGACVSEELIPGSRWSSCAFVRGLLRDEIVDELELERFGLETYAPDVQGFALFKDGSHLFLWKELDRTLRELERYSPRDARRFIEFGARFRRFGDILRPWLLRPPPSRSELLQAFEEAGEDELLNEFVLGSARDVLEKYFESEHIKGFLCFYSVVSVWGGPSTPGTGYVFGHHASGEYRGNFGQWAFVRGGMGGITQALANAARHHGAVIRTEAPVSRVLVRDGRVQGLVLADGEEVAASVVLSNADPKRSLLRLLEPGDLDPAFRARVEGIDQRGSMARIHLLVDELPHYIGFDSAAPGPQHMGHQMLGTSVENFEQAWEAQRRGTMPAEYAIEAIIQSVTDPTLAPAGQHTLTLGVQQLPTVPAEGSWDLIKERWADKVMEDFCRYAPNIRNHVLARHVITPLDLERDYNITGGNIFHGQMTLDQLFGARPLPELAHYRTPVAGYYLCGAGQHPGGGVMGAPGHNAAKLLLADLRGESDEAPPRRGGGKGKKRLVDRLLETPIGQDIGYKVARSRTLRKLTQQATKTRKS
ncbi:MAG: NAD(P)/FAD-dependent oxidoreductase [Dongiaceae bacterium]